MAKPSIIKRAQLALRVFAEGLPWARYGERKATPFLWPSWREGKPEWQITDFQSYVAEGYNLNSLIYSAIAYKARSVTAAPLRAYGGDLDHPEPLPPGHKLSRLLSRPNPYQSGAEFMQLNTVYLNLAGNCFIYMDRPRSGGFPQAMLSLRPDRVFIVPANKGIKGYLYVPEGRSQLDGIPMLPQDVMHVKLPNPADPLEGMGYGLSPLTALAQSADVDNSVTRYLKTFFDKGTMNNLILSFDMPLSDDEIVRIRKRWQEVYGGAENWNEVGVLDQSGKVERLSLTFDEMGFAEIDERSEARILGPFGVPGILIGSRSGLARSTYSNYEQARQAFWQDTFIPELGLFETEFDYYLAPEDNSFIRFDLAGVPALQQDLGKQVEAAYKLFQMAVPPNTAFEVTGVPVGKIPGGDIGYLPLNLVPVGKEGPIKPSPRAPEGGPEPPPAPEPAAEAPSEGETEELPKPKAEGDGNEGAPEAEEEGRKGLEAGYHIKAQLTEEAKANLWKAADSHARSWEGEFAEAAEQCLERDKREMLALVGAAKSKAIRERASIDWENLNTDVAAYLKGEGGEQWRSTFVPLLKAIITERATSLNEQFGIEFDVRNLLAEQWFEQYTLRFAQPINQTTSDAISELLRQGTREGWSVPEMQKRLSAMFSAWQGQALSDEERQWFEQRMPANRTEAIARTETMRAENSGSAALYKDWGASKKEWLSTRDPRTRDAHMEADGQIVKTDEAFSVGGESLMFPGDPAASAEQTVNCRCTILPVLE